MRALPASWTVAPIGAVTSDCSQRVPAAAEKFLYIDIGSIDRDTKDIVSPQQLLGSNAPSRARKHIKAGDVLVSMTRPNLNAVALVAKKYDAQIASTGFDVLRTDVLDPRWLFYFVRTDFFIGRMSDLVQGALYPAVRSKEVRGVEIPIAPHSEQKRIADKLDAVLARVAACRDHLDRVPAILKRFRQSVLAAATSGKLTEDWKEATGQFADWRRTPIGMLLTDIRYGTAKKCAYEPEAIPVVRIPNLINGRVSHVDLKYADFDEGERVKLSLDAGDLLMIRSNGSVELVGHIALATQRENGFLFAGYLIRLRVDRAMAHPEFVALALSSPESRRTIELTARSTSGVNNINTEEIKSLAIALPPLDEQAEIVRRVQSLFAWADRLEARHAAARTHVERLTPALLAKAFRGELVPQDPADEPASELLERLRQRPTDNPTGLPKRQGAKRSRADAPQTASSA